MNGSLIRRLLYSTSCLLAAGAIACSGSGSPTAPESSVSTSPSASGSGGGGASGGSAQLAVNLTDSPFSDAKALLLTFSTVSVHRADDGSWQTVPFASGSSRTCDLKKLQGPTDVLGVGMLPAGHYTQVRLVVSSAVIYFDNASTSASACATTIAAPAGANAPVDIPSGEVKLNQEFTLASGGSPTTMLLDFDGDQSVRLTGSGNGNGGNGNGNGNGNGGSNGKYMMSPVVRVVSVH